jgi:hypothetical protein
MGMKRDRHASKEGKEGEQRGHARVAKTLSLRLKGAERSGSPWVRGSGRASETERLSV